jgi:D-3-phosphoglycerate dehydrogenase / 2-oxoglutarate reductase
MRKALFTAGKLGSRYPGLVEYLREYGIELLQGDLDYHSTDKDVIEEIRGYEAILAGSEPYSAKVLQSSPNLKVIARVGVGYDKIDLDAATDRGVYVTWAPIPEFAKAEAEHAFALILSFEKKISFMNREIREGIWRPDKWGSELDDLYHLSLGIFGLGRIGAEVARRARAFDMSVFYNDLIRRPELETNLRIEYLGFEELLEKSDILTIHVPLTPATNKIIDTAALGRMKKNAVLINTARGALIDEEALATALLENELGGACLDVLVEEPPMPANVFYKLGDRIPNLILTQHTGYGPHTGKLLSRCAADEVIRVFRNEEPINLLNTALRKRKTE